MIHILFMILKALGILILVLLFLVLLIVCTVLFLPFCYRAQVLKEEEGFACVKASGRVSWLFGAVALTASYEEQKPEAQILLFGASLETWKRRLKKIRRGEASVPRTEENETENALEAEKTAEQKAPDQKEKQQKVTAPKKVTGTVRVGFNDPALTGETLGILGMIYGKLPKDLSIQPDFEQEILQGDVRMKGSFQAVTAAGIALRLFRDQNLRKTIRHFKHKEA